MDDTKALVAALRGGLQGVTMGFGDELTGVAAGEMQRYVNLMPQALRAPFDLRAAQPLDAYRHARDAERSSNTTSEQAHPLPYGVGMMAGGLATPLPASAGKAAGAAIGGVAGVGFNDDDLLTSSPEARANALADALRGAGTGAAVGHILRGGSLGATVAPVVGRGRLKAVNAKTPFISSQRYLNEDVISEKLTARDFDVQYVPITAGGQRYMVIVDGHHSLEAAQRAGVAPRLVRQDEVAAEAQSAMARGDKAVDEWLQQQMVDSPFHFVENGREVW